MTCQHPQTRNRDRIEREVKKHYHGSPFGGRASNHPIRVDLVDEQWFIDTVCVDCGETLASAESILPVEMEQR